MTSTSIPPLDGQRLSPCAPWTGPYPSLPPGDLWVFGYGSLMWDPGFAHLEETPARIHGYHRALCVWSWVYRGTRSDPGLVFGLDRGGSCVGIARRVARSTRSRVVEYLYEREMVTRVYRPVVRPVRLHGGGVVSALTFAVNRDHPQYAGGLSAREAAETILRARGRSGPNRDYVANTLAYLRRVGLQCSLLEEVQRALAER